ncbi:MAG: Phage integrase [Candidatus Amesbacteria bacterium GW2011_GWC1_47_15]|uniref:Phage integrase n=1 Tax=Candidatus Amesbacteria bacterium GW2011_GWC1_47_15 TaxID=1618364 RepID=A0A0G1UAU2_9BACT|nr:MAG: Phage integrase [Candidatus Amesbacteria bacterium GW2011_GWC1_47_15]
MPARNLAPRTRREYSHDLADLITFLEYAGVDRVGEIGLAHLDRVLSQSECDRLREACGSNLRDRAIIELLLQTGIRLSELVRLKVNDIDSPGPGKPVWCGLRRVTGIEEHQGQPSIDCLPAR